MRRFAAVALATLLLGAAPNTPRRVLQPVPRNGQTAVVTAFLDDMKAQSYAAAYALLNDQARAYYRSAANFRSIYDADRYRITRYALIGTDGNAKLGRVYFVRETAAYHDHAHEIDGTLTATVPLGVVPAGGGWRIKDPGHPWRAFAPGARVAADGVTVTVKKVSFFNRRIEAIVTFANVGDGFVTLLPYGKSVLRDDAGGVYRVIETKDWTLTDKQLFEGVRLAPSAQYTGVLDFESPVLDRRSRSFTLTLAPLLRDGGDAPFALEVAGLVPPHG